MTLFEWTASIAISVFLGFMIGFYVGYEKNSEYWIKRIKQGHVPSAENAKQWNP